MTSGRGVETLRARAGFPDRLRLGGGSHGGDWRLAVEARAWAR